MDTYTWQIEWMKALPQAAGVTDVVVEAGWRVTATQDEHSASAYGSVAVAAPENIDGSFIPFDRLTETQVLGWVWAGGVDRDATEQALARQIAEQINPPVVPVPLPWA